MSKAKDIVLINDHGVEILETVKFAGHYGTANAECYCGCELIVSPAIFNDPHEKGNPVLRCTDHGVHAYFFKDLIIGQQTKEHEKVFGPNE